MLKNKRVENLIGKNRLWGKCAHMYTGTYCKVNAERNL
jgi:hypothetical protein